MSNSAQKSAISASETTNHLNPPRSPLPSRLDLSTWNPPRVLDFVLTNAAFGITERSAQKLKEEDIDGSVFLKFGCEFKFWREMGFSVGECVDLSNLVKLFDDASPASSTLSTAFDLEEADEKEARRIGEKMKKLAEEEGWTIDTLADPHAIFNLPFPAIRFPSNNHFNMVDGAFQFVGREKIKLLYELLMGTDESQGLMAVSCYGTEGYGRSHIIAALVVLLMVEGRRVVYVPDCSHLLSGCFQGLRRSLFMAFHNKPKIRAKIRKFETLEDIERFCDPDLRLGYRGRMIFIFNGYDGLFEDLKEDENGYSNWDYNMEEIRSFLDRISYTSRRLLASAATEQLFRFKNTRRDYRHWVELQGGFSEEEYNTWWSLQKNVPPNVDQKELGIITGRVPSFLKAAITFPPYSTDWINGIYDKALEFSREFEERMLTDENEVRGRMKLDEHYEYLDAIIYLTPNLPPKTHLLDHRYYYYQNREFHPTAPFLYKAAQRSIFNSKIHHRPPDWYHTLIKHAPKEDAWTTRFAIEGQLISSILSRGLPSIDKRLKGPSTLRSFSTASPDVEMDAETPGCYLYVSTAFTYPAFDMLLVKTTAPRRKCPASAVFVPIKVTLNQQDARELELEEREFFGSEMMARWEAQLGRNGVEVETVLFVWITPYGGGTEKVEGGSLGFGHRYRRVIVAFGEVDEKIEETLREVGFYGMEASTTSRAGSTNRSALELSGTADGSSEVDAAPVIATKSNRDTRKRAATTRPSSESITSKKTKPDQAESAAQSMPTTGLRRSTRIMQAKASSAGISGGTL